MGCKPCKNNILRVHYRALIAAGTSLANMVASLTPSQEKIQWYKTTLSRISDIVRSNVNELLDQMEDPEKMVRQMVRDMESEVDRVTSAVGTAVAGVRRKERAGESTAAQYTLAGSRRAGPGSGGRGTDAPDSRSSCTTRPLG